MTSGRVYSPAVVLLRIFSFFVLPVGLIFSGLIPYEWRLYVLGAVVVFTVGITLFSHWSLISLGMRTDNISSSARPYIIFTLLGVFGLVLLASLLGKTPNPHWYKDTQLLLFFIPISIAQEFLYRSFLMKQLSFLHLSFLTLILTNTFLFTLLHSIYGSPMVVLPLTFFAGLGFAWMFKKYPNFYLISLSHAVLNFVAVLYMFF